MSGKPVGSAELLFDLPYTTVPARLDNAEAGLLRPVALVDREATYAAEVTLLDVADHRLIRSGLELAHRVIEGRGDWYLRAPDWQPLLPAERIEPFAEGDLPEQLGDLVMPFRRLGALGPVAAISYERQSFELRSTDGEPVGRLRDDRVTIRRGGVITARFREVRVEPGPAGLDHDQQQWLTAALEAVGGSRVTEFPSLAARIGTPATGLTDYPRPRPIDDRASFENFTESVIAGRLLELISADLRGRTGAPDAITGLTRVVDGLRAELNGLASALEPDWLADLDEELGWLAGALADVSTGTGTSAHAAAGGLERSSAAGDHHPEDPRAARLRSLLRRERYLRLLELLVGAVRGPQVDPNTSDLPAAETLVGLLDDAVGKLLTVADGLGSGTADADWDAAAVAAEDVARISHLARLVVGKKHRRAARRLRPAIALLIAVRDEGALAEAVRLEARSVGAADAFELGRRYQQHRQRQATARQEFLDDWAGRLAKAAR